MSSTTIPVISQHMPEITINKMELNRLALFKTLNAPTYKLFMAIIEYMMGITEKGKHGKSTILRTNKLTIDPQFIFDKDVVIKANYKKVIEANRNARKLTKALVKANVLAPLEEKDQFILNPHFFYVGNKYGDCYKEWCKISGNTFEQKHNADYSKRDEKLNYWYRIEDPDIAKAEWKEFYEEVDAATSTPYPSCELALPDPTSHFDDYLNLNPRDQFTSPYSRSYMSLADQYNRQVLGNEYITVQPDTPLSEAPDLSKPWTLPTNHPNYNPF